MKKNYYKTVLLITLSVVSVLALSSCQWISDLFRPKPNEGEKAIVLLVANEIPTDGGEYATLTGDATAYSHDTDAGYVYDALKELKDGGKISYTGTDSEYGFMIEAFDGIELQGNEYIALYFRFKDGSFDDTLMDKEWSKPISYGDKIYYSANVGISSLPLSDGMEILLVKGTW
ncbi:MAG: hypothetical protein LBT20_04075 [Clostridiales bacterium]|jgi:hypothetical protein|nr:hypothetical protein [Clostridiales bacterium]